MAACSNCGNRTLVGGFCANCDGQPVIVDRETARLLLGRAIMPSAPRNDALITQYGGKGVIKYNPTVDETQQGIKSEVTLVAWSSPDRMPHRVAVDLTRAESGSGGTFPLGTILLNAVTAKLSYRPYAKILIGMGSVMLDPFFCDIGRGQRLNFTASYVAVTAAMAAPPPAAFGLYVSGSMCVAAGLGWEGASTSTPVLFTMFVDALAGTLGPGANVQNIVIPPRAQFLQLVEASGVGSSLQLDFLDNGGTLVNTVQFFAGTQISPIPMMADYYSINVTNLNLAAVNVRLPFVISA